MLRSSNDLNSQKVQMNMTEKVNEVTLKNERLLQFHTVTEDDGVKKKHRDKDTEDEKEKKTNILNIKIADITDVKVKNFTEKLTQIFVVSLTAHGIQYFMEFETIDKRDDWGNGLRSLHHAHQWAQKPVESEKNTRKLHLIKQIILQKPRYLERYGSNSIVSMDIELASGDKVSLDIPETRYDSDNCKEITNDCVFQNNIIPAEGASLYRFVRSVISRMLMERETNNIIVEIDKQRYAEVMRGHTVSAANASTIRGLLHTADDELRHLAGAVPGRIGKHGPSSQLLVDILLRSIEKTKIYNKMAFTCNYGVGEELDF